MAEEKITSANALKPVFFLFPDLFAWILIGHLILKETSTNLNPRIKVT